MKIYTKTGDKGQTSTLDGQRVSKSHPQIDLYGEVDELNSWIGFLVAGVEQAQQLTEVQNRLFELGSHLACQPTKRKKFKLPALKASDLKKLEKDIDNMTAEMPELKNFILPGGSELSARAHLCRTMCRRLERKMASAEPKHLPKLSLEYVNRLSDYFFTLARYLNFKANRPETIWKL